MNKKIISLVLLLGATQALFGANTDPDGQYITFMTQQINLTINRLPEKDKPFADQLLKEALNPLTPSLENNTDDEHKNSRTKQISRLETLAGVLNKRFKPSHS